MNAGSVNSFFETTHLFAAYTTEHYLVVTGFIFFCIWFVRMMRSRPKEDQRRILLWMSVVVSLFQLAKIPLNLYTGVFDVTKDIPLHMCNFLPFVLVWVFYSKSRVVWATIFFWVILGASQANLTPTTDFALFYYDSIRYWVVHLFIVLLTIYPAIVWKWDLELKDVWRTFVALNAVALVIYFFNLMLGSNYLYIMYKPDNASLFALFPPWPTYILVIEGILIAWSLVLFGVFKMIRNRSLSWKVVRN
tara:strand:+ start:16424 stop:17167 length:744 start_codon:yes stop_codon:yes gene_type:complete